MEEFNPSDDFVESVMRQVRLTDIPITTEQAEQERRWRGPAKYAISGSSIFFALFHILRMFFSAFAPAVCN